MALNKMRDARGVQGLLDLATEVRSRCGENLTMVEVGSYAGESSEVWSKTGLFKSILCVDLWTNGFDPKDAYTSSTAELAEKDFDIVAQRCPNIRKFKGDSAKAIAELGIADGSVDFVYIDANHEYDFIKSDIQMWLPKVKKGGILSGHDFIQMDRIGVIRAVRELLGEPYKTFCDTSWMVLVD